VAGGFRSYSVVDGAMEEEAAAGEEEALEAVASVAAADLVVLVEAAAVVVAPAEDGSSIENRLLTIENVEYFLSPLAVPLFCFPCVALFDSGNSNQLFLNHKDTAALRTTTCNSVSSCPCGLIS
jgi:hypothetical protein